MRINSVKLMNSMPKKVSLDLKNDIDSQDNTRVTFSLGLIAIYIAVVGLLGYPSVHPNSIADLLKLLFTLIWGFSTFFLVIYIFLHAISLKYSEPNKIELIGSKIRIKSRLKEVFFDMGVENYLTGIVIYGIYNIPFYLIEHGMNQIFAYIIFLILVLLLSLTFKIIEKRQEFDNS